MSFTRNNRRWILCRSEYKSIRVIFDELSDEIEVVAIKRDDYVSRASVTQRPIDSTDVTSFQVLHELLRTFNFVMKLVYHLCAEVLDWKEGASNFYLIFLKEARSEIPILTKTEIKLDFPDSSGQWRNYNNWKCGEKSFIPRKYSESCIGTCTSAI